MSEEVKEESPKVKNLKKKFYKRWWFWLIISVVVVWLSVTLILTVVNSYPSDLINLPEAEYKAKCETYAYADIERYPDTYNKRLAKFTGEVLQVSRGTLNKLEMRVAVTLQGEEEYSYYTDAVYVFYTMSDGVNILEGDIITMYGELRGIQIYRNVLDVQISIPKMYVKFIDIIEP